jgi:hypothetical protein
MTNKYFFEPLFLFDSVPMVEFGGTENLLDLLMQYINFRYFRFIAATQSSKIMNFVAQSKIYILFSFFSSLFYNMRNSIFTTGAELRYLLEDMQPMFPPKVFAKFHNPKSGKYRFADKKRSKYSVSL